MSTQAEPPSFITGHQNQVNFQTINHFAAPSFTLNGRPATAEDSFNVLTGRLESAERELEAHKATIQAQQEQIYLQQEIINQLRQELARLEDHIYKLQDCNASLNQLISSGIRRRA